MFNPRNAYALAGTMLFLVAVFLVLDNAQGANRLAGTFGRIVNGILRTLQGR